MADAYGILTLTVLEETQINFQALVNTLNNYSWANHETEWILSSANTICLNEHSVQYPSVFIVNRQVNPNFYISCDDGGEDDYFDYEEVTLNDLVATISQDIQSGWIEIAAVSHEKNRYLFFENLKIFANGTGFRTYRKYYSSGLEKFSESV
jgi:hypothetical protein